MKYIKILLIALTFSFFGLTAITTPVYAADSSNEYYNQTENVGEDVCEEPAVRKVLRFFGYFLQVARFFVPIILIVQGTFTFFKAVTSDADTELKKSAYAFGRKGAIALLVFFVPAILDAIFGLFSLFTSIENEYQSCKDCLLSPSECEIDVVPKVLGDDGQSRNCSIVPISDCAKYTNCEIKYPSETGAGSLPTCGPKENAKQYAADCSLKGINECAKDYYNCMITGSSSNGNPTCVSNGKYK